MFTIFIIYTALIVSGKVKFYAFVQIHIKKQLLSINNYN